MSLIINSPPSKSPKMRIVDRPMLAVSLCGVLMVFLLICKLLQQNCLCPYAACMTLLINRMSGRCSSEIDSIMPSLLALGDCALLGILVIPRHLPSPVLWFALVGASQADRCIPSVISLPIFRLS